MDIEVVVTRLDSRVREDLDGIIVIEDDSVSTLKKRNEVVVNYLSPVKRLLATPSRKQPGVLVVKLRYPIHVMGIKGRDPLLEPSVNFVLRPSPCHLTQSVRE